MNENLQAASPDAPVLEVNGLVTEFATATGLFRAVDDVSFKLHRGKTLCVVGESGSGKSVLARSILQIVDRSGRITEGSIHFAGRRGMPEAVDLANLPPKSRTMRDIRGRDIAMIFQEPMSSLSPVHKIGDQVGEVLRVHEKLSKRQANERAIELLRKVEIANPEAAADKYPFEFSGGMRQRAMIAMALACGPSVLIADEPTTALDVTIQAEILELIRSLQSSTDMAVLFITHDMGVVAEIADDIAVMRYGKVVEQGTVFEIFREPKHPYTQGLLQAVRDLDGPSARRLEMRQAKDAGQPILVSQKVRKEFPITSGFLGRTKDIIVAVNDADLELRAGENLGIVGESGSGKTTLGRCLQRIYSITSGEILYHFREGTAVDLAPLGTRELKDAWRDIRMVFQDPFASLNPRMTVEQIVAEPLVTSGTMTPLQIKERVKELLELVELPASAASRYPHAFSGGQRQRISIARAIAPNPRIIIADEATSALDVSLRTQVLDLLLDIQDRLDLSFIFISHDISVVRYFCDRIAVMYRGSIVETGPTEEVCARPMHDYTKSLLSAVPIPDPTKRGSVTRLRYHGP